MDAQGFPPRLSMCVRGVEAVAQVLLGPEPSPIDILHCQRRQRAYEDVPKPMKDYFWKQEMLSATRLRKTCGMWVKKGSYSVMLVVQESQYALAGAHSRWHPKTHQMLWSKVGNAGSDGCLQKFSPLSWLVLFCC